MRIRTIKPAFWIDSKVARLSRDARLLFLGLLNLADDDGRMLGSTTHIVGAIFPHDDDAAGLLPDWLDELVSIGMVQRYQIAHIGYLSVQNFRTHQRIDKPKASLLPAPPAVSRKRRRQVAAASATYPRLEGEGEGEREREGEEIQARKTRAPKHNPIWDVLSEEFGEPATRQERSLRGRCVADFRGLGLGDEEVADLIRQRAAEHRRRWPSVDCTAPSLLKHWTLMSRAPPELPVAEPAGYEALREIRRRAGDLPRVGDDSGEAARRLPPPSRPA